MAGKLQCNGWPHCGFLHLQKQCHTRSMAGRALRRNRTGNPAALSADAPARRASFNAVARLYDEMRPGYPQALFDDLCVLAGLGADSRLLEIGCGTGHATLPLARRGLEIDCVELGEQMAAVAREKLAGFHRVGVVVADFEKWNSDARYGLIFSASAYHWLNPKTRMARIAHRLEPGGWIAVWRNHHVRGSGASAEFFLAAQAVYAREAPQLAATFTGLRDSGQIEPVGIGEWIASGLFEDAQTRVYTAQLEYSAPQYVRLLDTYSDHRTLPDKNRARLFAGLVRLADDFGGKVTREQAVILEMARKRG
jgi:SAM-dependent methyltransferase